MIEVAMRFPCGCLVSWSEADHPEPAGLGRKPLEGANAGTDKAGGFKTIDGRRSRHTALSTVIFFFLAAGDASGGDFGARRVRSRQAAARVSPP